MKITGDFDYIVIGSGFGGSVSACRLAEKGYSVLVLEKGRSFKAEDFPKTNWNIKKYLWLPLVKCFGFQRISWFKEVLILSGTGVGGGSLVFGNTLMTPSKYFFGNEVWSKFNDWEKTLAPYYEKAKFMLGATKNPWKHKADEILEEIADEKGVKCQEVNVGVYFSEDKTPKDPYFNGEGPLREPCVGCAGCMVGCRYNAKNTLDKNYLYFAQKNGAIIKERRFVYKVEFKENRYFIHTYKIGSYLLKDKQIFTSKGIVFSGGVLGTMKLLLAQKYHYKTLPKLSNRLGENVMTNSEMLVGITNPDLKLNEGLAISSMVNPNPRTHVEVVKYPDGSSFMKLLAFPFAKGKSLPVKLIKIGKQVFSSPLKLARLYLNCDWAKSSIIFLVMQDIESYMQLKFTKFPFHRIRFKSKHKVPAYIPEGVEVMEKFADKVSGTMQGTLMEMVLNRPATAHILGGAPMGECIESGVIDKDFKVFGYPNMHIFDGSVIPCNLGVNPSLTITTLTEYGMAQIKKAP